MPEKVESDLSFDHQVKSSQVVQPYWLESISLWQICLAVCELLEMVGPSVRSAVARLIDDDGHCEIAFRLVSVHELPALVIQYILLQRWTWKLIKIEAASAASQKQAEEEHSIWQMDTWI